MTVQESTVSGVSTPKPRKVSVLFGVGIFLMPYVFAWFTLRAGYSARARLISFGWLALILVPYTVTSTHAPPGTPSSATSSAATSSSQASTPGDGRSFSQVATDALVNPQMNAITDKVARDAVDEYNMTRLNGDKIEVCVHAGMVAAAYLQAKDQGNYLNWKQTERNDCADAGMPSH